MTDKVDDNKRKAEIAAEYATLLSQDQDEPSIIKALCAKYSLEKDALDEIVAEARKSPKSPPKAAP